MPIHLPGVFITAAMTSVLAFLLFGFVIRNLRMPAKEQLLWLTFFIALPLQPVAFYLVRVPLDLWLQWQFGSNSTAYVLTKTLYAPLTEEIAKLIPLLVPAIMRDVSVRNFVRYAFAIGVGFAIGEMWFVAERIAREPSLGQLPFYQFGGYFGERLMTCMFHSAFVSIGLWQLRNRFWAGFAGAVFLHWLTNLPVFLMACNVGGIGRDAWIAIIFVALLLEFFSALALLTYFAFGRIALPQLFYGPRQCPECAAEYDAPLLALNFLRVRYERCPQCSHWHWTRPAPIGQKAPSDVTKDPAS